MFSTVPGQGHISDYIIRSTQEGKPAHSILLSGQAGYGLFALGKAIASWYLCSNREDEDACGTCPNCKKADNLTHPNLQVFFPTTSSKTCRADRIREFRELDLNATYFGYPDWLEHLGVGDKSLNINKLIINEILHAFSMKGYERGSKVYLIWGAEFLGKEGNKLLKVIEEPPMDSYIILLTENRNAILPTILSRCQILLLRPLSVRDLLQATDLEENDPNLKMAEQARGNVLELKKLREESASDDLSELWFNILRAAYKGRPDHLIGQSATVAGKGREYGRQFIKSGMQIIRSILQSQSGLPVGLQPSTAGLARLWSLRDLEWLYDRLQEDYLHINRNANLKILYSSLILELAVRFKQRKHSVVKKQGADQLKS